MSDNSMSKNSAEKSYEPFLDVLKGLAMLGVIWAHYCPAPNSILASVANIGARCPQLFFIVSAFLTWKAIDQHKKGGSYYPFYKKRFFRIAPIYWFALIIALLLPVVSFNEHSLGDIVSHILFLNGLVPQWTDNIMHVEWYIADLALFYIICPLLKKLAFNLKTSIITLLVTIVISTFSLIITNNIFAAQIESNTAFEMYFHTFFLLNQLPVWMLGVVLYYIIISSEPLKWKWILLALFVVIVVTLLFEFYSLNKRFLSSSLIAGLVFAWLFLFCNKIKWIFHYVIFKPFIWFGKYSFGIYCFHFVIISTLSYYGITNNLDMRQWTIGLILVIAISSLVGYSIERFWTRIQKRIIVQK